MYIGFELHGISYCNTLGKDQYMKCKSGISGKDIPLYFCKTYLPCQCALDSDCGDKKSCMFITSMCIRKYRR
jgi:hypothetical protein